MCFLLGPEVITQDLMMKSCQRRTWEGQGERERETEWYPWSQTKQMATQKRKGTGAELQQVARVCRVWRVDRQRVVYLKGKEGRRKGGMVGQKEGAEDPALAKGNKSPT